MQNQTIPSFTTILSQPDNQVAQDEIFSSEEQKSVQQLQENIKIEQELKNPIIACTRQLRQRTVKKFKNQDQFNNSYKYRQSNNKTSRKKTPIQSSSSPYDPTQFSLSPSNSPPNHRKPQQRGSRPLDRITRQFVRLITQKDNKILQLSQAASILSIHKRRIYDITNVLEGIGYIKKVQKNMVRWVGASNTEEIDLTRLRKELEELRDVEDELNRNIKIMGEMINKDFPMITEEKELMKEEKIKRQMYQKYYTNNINTDVKIKKEYLEERDIDIKDCLFITDKDLEEYSKSRGGVGLLIVTTPKGTEMEVVKDGNVKEIEEENNKKVEEKDEQENINQERDQQENNLPNKFKDQLIITQNERLLPFLSSSSPFPSSPYDLFSNNSPLLSCPFSNYFQMSPQQPPVNYTMMEYQDENSANNPFIKSHQNRLNTQLKSTASGKEIWKTRDTNKVVLKGYYDKIGIMEFKDGKLMEMEKQIKVEYVDEVKQQKGLVKEQEKQQQKVEIVGIDEDQYWEIQAQRWKQERQKREGRLNGGEVRGVLEKKYEMGMIEVLEREGEEMLVKLVMEIENVEDVYI